MCFDQPLLCLSAAHSANSTLARPASHWSRDERQIPVIGPFTASPQTSAPTTAAQWQSAPGIHLFKGPTGPIVCEMVHLGVFERFSGGAGLHEIRRFVILGAGRWRLFREMGLFNGILAN